MKQRGKSCLLLMSSWLSALFPPLAAAAGLPELDCLVEPHQVVNLGTPVRGVVENIYVERSDTVTKGQPLVQMESSVERATVARARVQSEMRGEIQLQQASLEFALRADGRADGLASNKAISIQKKDEATTEVALARYRLRQATESQSLAAMDLKRAQAVLALRTLRSPIDGVVVERMASSGEYVEEQPLLQLAQMDPLRVEAIAPVTLFGQIEQGMTAEVIPELQTDGPYRATVTIVDKVVDAASGTFSVRLELPNPDYRLPGGLKCRLRFLPQYPGPATAQAGNARDPVPERERIDSTLSPDGERVVAEQRYQAHPGPK